MDKKKMIYILSGVMGIMIMFIIVIALISSCSNKKMSYEKIEDNLRNAAISYFKNNETLLPVNDGSSVTVEASVLTDGGYMKPLSEMTGAGVSCSAKVTVAKNGDKYLYSPILNCGDNYVTKIFAETVKSNNSELTDTGSGLYKNGDVYTFKGEYVNNYVELDNKLWRILDIDKDGFVRLIYADKSTEEVYVWDNRYNIDKGENLGINDYSVSRIKDTLVSLENSDLYISEETKSKLAYRNICIGKRGSDNKSINNIEECETSISNQLFGLPYVSDYVNASVDSNCKTIDDKSCNNYNYLLNSSLSSWTLTGSKEKSDKVYSVSRSRYSLTSASNERAIRPTVYLSNNVVYVDGDGTQGNPYKIK